MQAQSLPEKPCPTCIREGVDPPNPRATTKAGRLYGYCTTHLRAYQNDRNHALTTIQQLSKKVRAQGLASLTEEDRAKLQKAQVTLEPKERGRSCGDNMCPRCQTNQREASSAYCKACRKEYQKERYEKRANAEAQLTQLLQQNPTRQLLPQDLPPLPLTTSIHTPSATVTPQPPNSPPPIPRLDPWAPPCELDTELDDTETEPEETTVRLSIHDLKHIATIPDDPTTFSLGPPPSNP